MCEHDTDVHSHGKGVFIGSGHTRMRQREKDKTFQKDLVLHRVRHLPLAWRRS